MFARMKTLSTVLGLVVVCLTLSATAMASEFDKETIITTNQPLEIPGQVVLPAGTYVIKLAELPSSRNVVQFFNADETKLYATVMGVPVYRPETPEKPEIILSETEKGNPYAIREWFYPGSNSGIEFPTAADHASKYASDAAIKSIVERNLEKRHLTPQNGAKIRVAVDDHVITLSGTVPSLKLMREAEEQARHAGDGVLVENHLSVADARKSDEQLAQEVAHAIRMYPRYDIFDWIEGTVHNGVVTLIGAVREPYRKSDYGKLVEEVAGVKQIENEVRVLPLSTFDDQIRFAASRAIYRDPQFRAYLIGPNPPIHIVVENGRVTLKGIVATPMEKQLAEMNVRTGVLAFEVNNDLQVEKLG
jgi:hyperosmotically inducible protein